MKYDKNLKCNVIKRRNFVKRKMIPKKRIAKMVNMRYYFVAIGQIELIDIS